MNTEVEGRATGNRLMKTIVPIIQTVVVLAAGIGILYGVNSYLDSKIEAKIKDPAFLLELAKSQRPSMVFDAKGTIVSDFGAMRLLREFRVEPSSDKKAYVVTVTPNEFLGVEPLLESLDHNAVIHSHRGKGLEWVMEIRPISSIVSESSPKPGPMRFRLEILR